MPRKTGDKQADKPKKQHIVKQDTSGKFLPGNCSGGRPATSPEIKEMCQALAPRAIEIAHEILNSGKTSARDKLTAAGLILDRAYGKAPQAVSMDVNSPQRFLFVGMNDVMD